MGARQINMPEDLSSTSSTSPTSLISLPSCDLCGHTVAVAFAPMRYRQIMAHVCLRCLSDLCYHSGGNIVWLYTSPEETAEAERYIMPNQNDSKNDDKHTFVVLNNEWNQNNSRDLIGNVYRSRSMTGFLTSGLPSYTDVTSWCDLTTTSFMLCGITVEGGHAGMPSVQLEAIIKSLNSSANYEYTLSVKAFENKHAVLVGVVETDVFTIGAFCFGIQLAAGWDCGSLNCEHVEISNDDTIFEINVPISWVPGK